MFMVVIFIFKAVYDSLSTKWKPGLILRIFNSSVNYVKDRIISLSIILLTSIVRMALQSYKYMTYIYFPVWCCRSSFVVIGSTVV